MRRLIVLSFLALALLASGVLAAETKIVKWDCPSCATENVVGYRLYYGQTSHIDIDAPTGITPESPYDQVVEINDVNQMSHTLTLPVGTWFIRITGVRENGQESDFTYELGIKIKPSAPTSVEAGDLVSPQ